MKTAHRLRRLQLRLSLVLTAAAILLVVGGYQLGFFVRADSFFYDLLFTWRGPQALSGNVVLVLEDDFSAQALGRKKGSWSRQQLATALNNLCAAGANVIGLDLILAAEDTDPGTDQELAQAMATCNNVILARVASMPGVGEIPALPIFQEAMLGDGFIDLPQDRDQILRKIPFLTAKPLPDGSISLLPSFSLEIARTFLNLAFKLDFSSPSFFLLGEPAEATRKLPYPDLMINFAGDSQLFQTLHFSDVVRQNFSEDMVSGKIVLLGSSLAVQNDFFRTAYSRFDNPAAQFSKLLPNALDNEYQRQDPGIACHAFAIETILAESFIQKVSSPQLLLGILALGVAGLLFYWRRVSLAAAIVILLAGSAGLLGGYYLLFRHWRLWLEIGSLLAIVMLQFTLGMLLQRAAERKKNEMVVNIFGKYVSPGVVKELVQGDIDTTLEGKRAELTIFFSDLRSFTNLAEKMSAKQIGRLLNVYFDAMIPVIFTHGGTLDKLMGDAIMAFFGSPVLMPDHAAKGAMAALQMLASLEELKKRSEQPGVTSLEVGIGLNTGEVTVGNLGSPAFMDYTVIGDVVNLASRLEGLNKVYGTKIILGEQTASGLDHRFVLRELDRVRVKGKQDAVTIYELLGLAIDIAQSQREMVTLFAQALTAYRNRQWSVATALFRKALDLVPGDGPTELYLKRLADCEREPPPEDWQAETTFDSK